MDGNSPQGNGARKRISPQQRVNRWRRYSLAGLTVVFGLLLPCLVIINAFLVANKVSENLLTSNDTAEQLLVEFPAISSSLKTPLDYSLFAAVFLEKQNSQTFTNKQLLKTVVLQLGFAVMLVGLAFIVLGVEAGPVDVGAEATGVTFNLKTGSVGVVTFLAGALMASGGGLLSNTYKGVSITPAAATAGPTNTTPTQPEFKTQLAKFVTLVKTACEQDLIASTNSQTMSADVYHQKVDRCLGRALRGSETKAAQ